jgi:hypothetical protein
VGKTMVRMVVVEGAAKKKKAEKDKNRGERLLFFVNFRVDFLFSPNMQPATIYRGGRG